jgi:predicted lipid-binding transport protein (Tim44 family)
VTDSPLSAGELRAAAETHEELPPEYRDAVLDSFVERVGREIDARVDTRLAQVAAQPLAAQRMAQPPAPRQPKPYSVMAVALGSIALGIPLTAIVVATGTHPAGLAGLLVVWIAIAVINVAYAAKMRPPDHR